MNLFQGLDASFARHDSPEFDAAHRSCHPERSEGSKIKIIFYYHLIIFYRLSFNFMDNHPLS